MFARSTLLCSLLVAASGVAHASPVLTATFSPNGLPAATGTVDAINLNNATLGSFSGVQVFNAGADQVSISVAANGAIVQGSDTGAYAAPVTGGTVANPTYVTTPYLSTGGLPGIVGLGFSQEQSYLGFLWGSIGSGDTISFYDSGNLIASYTGAQAQASAAGYSAVNGAQGYNGSEYVMFNLTGATFNTVILSQTGSPSFESADYEYSSINQVAVPEPASVALLGSAVIGLVAIGRRRGACA